MSSRIRIELSWKGMAGLLVGCLAAAVYLGSGLSGAAAPTQEPRKQPYKPSERIDVEQAVDFPYDI